MSVIDKVIAAVTPPESDKDRAEAQAYERLSAELRQAFAAPESAYHPLTAAEVLARNRT